METIKYYIEAFAVSFLLLGWGIPILLTQWLSQINASYWLMAISLLSYPVLAWLFFWVAFSFDPTKYSKIKFHNPPKGDHYYDDWGIFATVTHYHFDGQAYTEKTQIATTGHTTTLRQQIKQLEEKQKEDSTRIDLLLKELKKAYVPEKKTEKKNVTPAKLVKIIKQN
jgi:hypothetical protein